ncbi:GFA family protein [Microbulbifer sp.]|uniref:GFA family protein n=1 Tax=Microbulbifer sp. TaxID=1908541 RepID=UPI00338F6B70
MKWWSKSRRSWPTGLSLRVVHETVADDNHPLAVAGAQVGRLELSDRFYEITGEPGPTFNSHCSKCRRWLGAVFGTRATIKSTWLKGEEHLSGHHSSENTVKTFCSICGSSLISTYEQAPPQNAGAFVCRAVKSS